MCEVLKSRTATEVVYNHANPFMQKEDPTKEEEYIKTDMAKHILKYAHKFGELFPCIIFPAIFSLS